MLFLLAGTAAAQNCMQPQYSTYESYVATNVNSTHTQATLSVSATVDGGGGYYCQVPLPGVAHTPSVYISVNGSAAEQQGQGVPPQYAIDYTATHAATVPIGAQLDIEDEEWVDCNYAGQLFDNYSSWFPQLTINNYALKSQTVVYSGGVPYGYDCQYQISCPQGYGHCALPAQYLDVYNIVPNFNPCGNFLWTVNIYFPSLSECIYDVGHTEEQTAAPCT